MWSSPTRARAGLPPAVYLSVCRPAALPIPSPLPLSSFSFFFFAQLSICLHNCISSELYLLSLLSNQYEDDRRTPAVRYRSRGVRQICLCQSAEARWETLHWWRRGDLVLFNLPKSVPSASPLTLFCQNCSLVLDLAGQINMICGQKNPNRSLA